MSEHLVPGWDDYFLGIAGAVSSNRSVLLIRPSTP